MFVPNTSPDFIHIDVSGGDVSQSHGPVHGLRGQRLDQSVLVVLVVTLVITDKDLVYWDVTIVISQEILRTYSSEEKGKKNDHQK